MPSAGYTSYRPPSYVPPVINTQTYQTPTPTSPTTSPYPLPPAPVSYTLPPPPSPVQLPAPPPVPQLPPQPTNQFIGSLSQILQGLQNATPYAQLTPEILQLLGASKTAALAGLDQYAK